MKKRVLLIVCFIMLGSLLFAQTSFARGEELFLQNKPQDALSFLERAVLEDPAHVQASLYLGIAYQQLDRFDEAIAVYRKILPRAGTQTALVSFNLGNVYFSRGNAVFAEQYYSQAVSADPVFASAYLNRANSRIKNGKIQESIPDYEQYLSLEPNSPKRSQIESLIAFIQNEAVAAEQQRIMAEAAARAEAERRQRLLDEVSASLQASAAEHAQGLSAGAESVEGYEGAFELE